MIFPGADVAARLAFLDGGGDAYGYDAELVRRWIGPAVWMYRRWFRVVTRGAERVPRGRVLLVANHSGQIPIDGLMIAVALLLEGDPPRFVRSMADRWLPTVPWVSTLFARTGQLVGHPENCRALLEREQAVLVFPEGARGMTKPFRERYQLRRFGRGFARIAAETGTPVVPVSVVGAEEQYVSLANVPALGRALNMPAFPVMPQLAVPLLGWLPLPTRYYIQFGEPIRLDDDDDEDHSTAVVRSVVQRQVRADLDRRPSVFA